MRSSQSRTVVAASAILTAVIMIVVTGVIFTNGAWSEPATGAAMQPTEDLAVNAPIALTVVPVLVTATPSAEEIRLRSIPTPTTIPTPDVAPLLSTIDQYKNKLDEAYANLKQAYAQIEALQTNQRQLVAAKAQADAANEAAIAAYKKQLSDSYAALQAAYDQINTLQQTQGQSAPGNSGGSSGKKHKHDD